MALELHVSGPGLDVVRRLEPGGAELVLGRDADCGICLPDPQRNVSRRHLAVWTENDELHFRVLSVVNGIEMPFGEAPPGARGVLPTGQSAKVGDYTLVVSAAAVQAGAAEEDPWAVFDRQAADSSQTASPVSPSPARGSAAAMDETSTQDDPFGDWGMFETTFGPGAALEAGKLGEGDLSSFFQGLGLDPATIGTLSQGEIEAIGRAVRIVATGLLDFYADAARVKQDLRAEDRTMVASRDNNPLKTDWPVETKLRYLFGGRAASVGFPSPERSLRDMMADLLAHNGANGAAARAAVESTLKEFDPAALKTRLLGGSPRLFEGARAWEAYVKFYEEQGKDLPGWAQQLLDRYFSEAYLRESQRIRRETAGRER